MTTGEFLCFGPCWACKSTMAFDPEKVPSILVNGENEPLCARCVGRANKLREGSTFPPIVPLPGAWGPGT